MKKILTLGLVFCMIFCSGIGFAEEQEYYVYESEFYDFNEDVWAYRCQFDSQDNLIVSDFEHNKIRKFDRDENLIAEWYVDKPYTIAVDQEDCIYVIDSLTWQVLKFDPNGNEVLRFGDEGSQEQMLGCPYGLEVDQDGNIYISERHLDQIKVFDSNGVFLYAFGETGSEPGQFDYPKEIVITQDRYLYVVDSYNHRIQKFTLQGEFLLKWGAEGSSEGEFIQPASITADIDGNVYCPDNNGRIQKFDYTGGYITEFTCPRALGIAIDHEGVVFLPAIVVIRKYRLNNAPTAMNKTVFLKEVGDYSFSVEMFEGLYRDVDQDPLTKIKITSLPQNGTLTLAGIAVEVDEEISVTQLDGMVFVPDSNNFKRTEFTWLAHDGIEYADEEVFFKIMVNSKKQK